MAKRTARMGDWDLQVFVADPDCFANIFSIAKKPEMREKVLLQDNCTGSSKRDQSVDETAGVCIE